ERTYGITADVLYNVATHYTVARPVGTFDWKELSPRIDTARCKFVYTGSTPAGFYDVAAVVSAVKELRAQDRALADRLQLIFVGACEEVRAEVARQQLPDGDIVVAGHVPHGIARDIQQNAEGLLFLAYRGEGNKGVVSTKIFEYLALGKPILPISLHEGSDVD